MARISHWIGASQEEYGLGFHTVINLSIATRGCQLTAIDTQ